MFCGFFLLIKSSIIINHYQKENGTKLFDSVGFFFLAWFYLLGIFIIQPKLRTEIKELRPNIKLEEDDVFVKTEPNLIRRIFAFLIDYGIIFAIFIPMVNHYKDKVNHSTDVYLALALLGLWICFLIITEMTIQSTFGNYILGLKVIQKNGSKIQVWQSFLRHLVDFMDAWPFGILGFCTIKFTPNNQRLGDLLANTIVIKRKTTANNNYK